MAMYQSEECWALCSNIQTISISRVLPPSKKSNLKLPNEPERNPRYIFRISRSEDMLLRNCLSMLAEISREEFLENKKQIRSLTTQVQDLQEMVASLEVYKRLCDSYGLQENDLL